jgi:ABC-type uncharacterized transport system permease subunit
MSEELMVVLNVAIIFGTIAFVIKTLADNRVRNKAIEKGILDEQLKGVFAQTAEQFLSGLNAIKWGMVLIGIGLAIVAGRFLPYGFADEGTIGLALIFSGIAFIIYYQLYKKAESSS